LPGRMDTQRALIRDYGKYVGGFDTIADYLARRQPPSLMLWGGVPRCSRRTAARPRTRRCGGRASDGRWGRSPPAAVPFDSPERIQRGPALRISVRRRRAMAGALQSVRAERLPGASPGTRPGTDDGRHRLRRRKREAIAAAAAIVALLLWRANGALMAVGWIAAQAGGGVLNLALKETFERTRPAFADPLLAASSWSFPSGHAMGTFILFGLGCYVLLRETASWTVAAFVVTLSLAWCIVMAFSRLYLGVHFASDVAAGLIAGVAWVAVCASALEVVRPRRAPRNGAARDR
jgi:membrane-associated phospholipid phosphatase